MYSYNGCVFQLLKTLCLSEMSTEAPFLRTESFKDSPPPALSLLVMFRMPSNLIGPGAGLLSQWVRHVSLPPCLSVLPTLPNTTHQEKSLQTSPLTCVQSLKTYARCDPRVKP